MEEFIPDFILQADNVYRTRNYIVKQRLEYIENTTEDNVIISYDTFYKRTRLRDEQYIIMQGFHSKRMLVFGPLVFPKLIKMF